MTNRGPERSKRTGIIRVQLAERVSDEAVAMRWFEAVSWSDGHRCPYSQGVSQYLMQAHDAVSRLGR